MFSNYLKGNNIDIFYVDRPTLRFDRNEQYLTVYEGTDFSLMCLAESNPITTEIFWKTDGQQIKQELDLVKQHSSALLNIENLKRKHEGNYTCVAKNEVGNVSQSIYIKVLCMYISLFTLVEYFVFMFKLFLLYSNYELNHFIKIQINQKILFYNSYLVDFLTYYLASGYYYKNIYKVTFFFLFNNW